MIEYYVSTTKGDLSKEGKSQMAFARMPPAEKVDLMGLIDYMKQLNQGLSRGAIAGCLCDFCDTLTDILMDGRRVCIDGLGTFSLSISSEAADSEEKFSSRNIRGVKVVFTPCWEMKARLADITFKRISPPKERL